MLTLDNKISFFRNNVLLVVFCSIAFFARAQETTVKGKVIDANSGDPIPYANIIFQGTTIGGTTDFDGNYQIKTKSPSDTLVVSYLGYKTKKKSVTKDIEQVLNFQLEEESTSLQEVVIIAGENPAFEILRKVVRNKKPK